MRGRALALALIIGLASSGCAGPRASDQQSSSPTPGAPIPTPFPVDDAFGRLVRSVAGGDTPAGSALDALWQSVLADGPGSTAYRPPSRVLAYRGGEIPESPCAARTSAGYWLNAARYCESDRTILYDEAWLRDFHARFGSFAPAAILAHEWGHHVQSYLGTSVVSNQFELQADCFAGMYLAASEQKSPGEYVIGGDVTAALRAFFELGTVEYRASEWFAAGEHGSRSQRMMAFGTGYLPVLGGLPWCFGYRDYKPEDFATIGPYRLLNLPGRTEEPTDAAYVIRADNRSGRETSDIVLTWIERLPIAGQGATLGQLRELWRIGYPGLTPLYAEISLDANVRDGTGIAQLMENRVEQADGSVSVQHGFFALASPVDGMGGMLILVTRAGPAPTEMADVAIVEEELVAVYQVINRLCGPDQSGDPDDPMLNVACLADQ